MLIYYGPMLSILFHAISSEAARRLSWSRPYSPWERVRSLTPRSDDRDSTDQLQKVTGVRKMTEDEGEMFFPEYWTLATSQPDDAHENFEGYLLQPQVSTASRPAPGQGNISLHWQLHRPYALHTDHELSPLDQFSLPLLPRKFQPSNLFSRRGFACVDGTRPCNSINRPNSCCSAEESCQLITDTGSGDVGCCAQGSGDCSNEVSKCQDGYESCPGAQGGGCCIPGYSCAGVGCK